eukprot:COSAG02_NODE_5701_length_4110_cov_2.049115_2_plen_194_part_00
MFITGPVLQFAKRGLLIYNHVGQTHVEVLADAMGNLGVRNDGAFLPVCQSRVSRIGRSGYALCHCDGRWVTIVVVEVYPRICVAWHSVDDSRTPAVYAQAVRAVGARLFWRALATSQRIATSDDAAGVPSPYPGCAAIFAVEVRGRLIIWSMISWCMLAETRATRAVLHEKVDVACLGVAEWTCGDRRRPFLF